MSVRISTAAVRMVAHPARSSAPSAVLPAATILAPLRTGFAPTHKGTVSLCALNRRRGALNVPGSFRIRLPQLPPAGLFFWAKTNPFGASLTALIIYVTGMIVGAALDPATLAQGWLIKILVIAALVSGVRSGIAYAKLKGAGQPE